VTVDRTLSPLGDRREMKAPCWRCGRLTLNYVAECNRCAALPGSRHAALGRP
jgi:hypothetical protein